MDEDRGENLSEGAFTHVISGHRACQTRKAKWLCLDNIYQKFHRPNFYDVGGTYIQDVADFWFMYKTEQFGDIYLLHLFISNRQETSFDVAVSFSGDLNYDKKNSAVYLTQSLKEYRFKKMKEISQNYITTYHFSKIDIDTLKDMKLYIAISFPVHDGIGFEQEIIDNVKASHDFSALLSDPIGSDFFIESADGEMFHVHKVLLAAHSEVFKAMLKVDTAESQNNYVKLVDICREDLQCILECIYTGTVKDLDNANWFNLLMLADRYNLKGLRELSQYALTQQLTIENALEILMIADMYNSDVLKNAALKFIKKNVSVIKTSTFKEMGNADLVRQLCEYLVPL